MKNKNYNPEDWRSRYLKTTEELKQVVDFVRGQGQKIVTTNGCFDLLHGGHLYILEESSAQGDILIVGINSDESVRGNKGKGRPLMPEDERAELLLAFEFLDYVYLYHDSTCVAFVEAVKPDVHVNDASYGEHCVESESVKQGGGRLHLLEKIDVPSTTDLIQKVVELD